MVTTHHPAFRVPAPGVWPSWINLVLGIWLFISAFLWPHTAAAQTNTWIVGVLIAIASIAAMFAPPVRWANTVLAVYLFISTFFIAHFTVGTMWNNLIVAIVVFVVSLTTRGPVDATGRPRAV